MSDFQAIYAHVRTIPVGQVESYGDVGRSVGVTARTVGFAMAACPEEVPWHRVVGSDGYLRIAKRSPVHFAEQKARLAEEGVSVDDRGFVPPEAFAGVSPEEPGTTAV